jgi:hypothetical protein
MVYLFWEITIGMLASSVDGHRFNIPLGHTKNKKDMVVALGLVYGV